MFKVQRQNHGVWLYISLFNQLLHNVLLECSPSLKQMLLQLQQKVNFNIHCNVKLVKCHSLQF